MANNPSTVGLLRSVRALLYVLIGGLVLMYVIAARTKCMDQPNRRAACSNSVARSYRQLQLQQQVKPGDYQEQVRWRFGHACILQRNACYLNYRRTDV